MNRGGCLIAAAALALACAAPAAAAAAQGGGVLTYHNSPDRNGVYIVPGLDWAHAAKMRLDSSFQPQFTGNLYAQPLYWRPSGSQSGQLIVATESNHVAAIDEASGNTLWQVALGAPVPRSALACGNIDPVGVTGTPVIDSATGTLYLDAFTALSDGPHHRIFALSLADHKIVSGWPVDVGSAVGGFSAPDQNQRAALALLGDRLYVAFGGHYGDCGNYHGWVIGVRRDNPGDVVSWSTRARAGGIWAPGGIASDGQSLFVGTGNTMDAATWQDGEAVIRLGDQLRHDENPRNFYTPRDWRTLDNEDLDLGGSNPMLLEVPAGGVAAAMVLALGKDGNAYLVGRDDLGGHALPLARRAVSPNPIRTGPAAYPATDGVYVAFQGPGAHCPDGEGQGLTALKIAAGPPARIATAWCAALDGAGSPVVTTTEGGGDPIVWVTGAEGDNQLHGYRGDNGKVLFAGGAMTGLRHFGTLIAAGSRLYVGADGRLYAFSF